MNKNFLLIADIKNHRTYPIRNLWLKFNKAVKSVNKDSKSLYPLTITLGDECQGVYTSLAEAKKAMTKFRKYMSPFSLRFVIVPIYGDLSQIAKVPSSFNPLNTTEMLFAQKKMKNLKKSKKSTYIQTKICKKTREKHHSICSLDYTKKVF